MSVPIEIFSGTDVNYTRVLMGQAGRVHQVPEEDEPTIAITTTKIYTEFKNISDVMSIYDNLAHSGTNYALSGTAGESSYLAFEGQINAGTAMTIGTEYFINYVHTDGLSDREIERSIEDAKNYIRLQLFRPITDAEFADTSTIKALMLRSAMLNKAAINAIAILNMGNIIQSGFNYSLGELRVETKLWGEGMSTESLLVRVELKMMELMDYLKLYYYGSIMYTSDRSVNEPSYDKGRWKDLTKIGRYGIWTTDGIVMSQQYRIIDPR